MTSNNNLDLIPEGQLKIEWAQKHMPVLNMIQKEFETKKALDNRQVAMCLHLEAKTACLALVLQKAGANVSICASNPLSTQDDVAAALANAGVLVYAKRGQTPREYERSLHAALEIEPDIIVDDGGDLVTLLHTKKTNLAENVIGGCEETTTGVQRLKAMERDGTLNFPMLAVNNAKTKYLFDNRYGTGQSTLDAIMRTTNLVIAGRCIVVSGYGWCGRGVAMRAKGLGANVIVTEVDPIRANEALMDGFRVMPIAEASKEGDIFITTTGCKHVITGDCFKQMKDGAILANAGHFDIEISKTDLKSLSTSQRTVRKNIEEFIIENGRRLYLLGEGRLVNLAAGDGHPVEIMDMSFALQALGVKYIAEYGSSLTSKVLAVPEELDKQVASLRLKALGVKIDELSSEQNAYLASWRL